MRIVYYRNERDTAAVSQEVTWDELEELLSTPRISAEKFGRAWSPVELTVPQRGNDNVSRITALVLDLDHLTEEQVESVGQKIENYRYIVHSTFSDMVSGRCLRGVLSLSRPLLPEEWRVVLPYFIDKVGIPADKACKDPARLYFLPTRPPGTEYFYASNSEGMDIDVDAILGEARAHLLQGGSPLRQHAEVRILRPPKITTLIDAAKWLEQHGPAIQGQNGDKHTYIACAALTHDFALSPDDAWPLLRAWNESCQPPWGEEELASKLRNAEQYAINEYGARRDDFQVQGYGTPIVDFFGRYSEAGGDTTWIIPGVLARGVAQVIAGPPKSMKTFLAEHMAISVAAGKVWLHGVFNPVKQGKVLVIPREDTPTETKRRLEWLARGMGVDILQFSDYLAVDAERPFKFDDLDDVKRMEATLEQWRPDVVFIDPLAEAHTRDENSASDMKIVIDNWADLCRRFNVAIVCLHHWRKPGEGQSNRSAGIRMRGTSALHARVRHVVGVESREKGLAAVGVEGNLPGLPDPFLVKMVDSVDNAGQPCIRVSFAGWQ